MADGATERVAGVILAGGRGSRFGGTEKGLLTLGGQPMIAHVIARIGPQVAALAINANSGDYAGFALPVIADPVTDRPGPLAGVLAGFEWMAASAPGTDWLLSVPCDAPDLPRDLVARLLAAAAGVPACEVVTAASAGRVHPVCALWHRSIAAALARDVAAGARAVGRWAAARRQIVVEFAAAPRDPFFNVNDRDALEAAVRSLSAAAQARPRG